MSIRSIFAVLALFAASVMAQAAPVDVSVNVTGSPGSWVYNFSLTNNLPGKTTSTSSVSRCQRQI
jgi:hypothetical protein